MLCLSPSRGAGSSLEMPRVWGLLEGHIGNTAPRGQFPLKRGQGG